MQKIICLGKNYLDHALEMKKWENNADTKATNKGSVREAERPSLFLKPLNAYVAVKSGESVEIPWTDGEGNSYGEVHPEIEVVLEVGLQEGKPFISNVFLGLDLTRRDLQAELKRKGQPWELAKGFKNSAIVAIETRQPFREITDHEFFLKINEKLCQKGSISQMLVGMKAVIPYVTNHFELESGDLIFTGTPAGVSSVISGQWLELGWLGKQDFCRIKLV